MTTLIDDKQFIKTLRGIGVEAKRWRNTGDYTPPADVNYKGELRVHTGGKPELIAADENYKQAIVKSTVGRYAGETFLVGMDETSNFVCRLPKPVESVQEAHDVLKPLGVGDHAKRQGEWFFTPEVIEDESKLNVHLDVPLEPSSSHRASYRAFHGTGMIVKGVVSDNRPGRHAPLDLGNKWHSVIRNTELTMDPEPQRVHRSFD